MDTQLATTVMACTAIVTTGAVLILRPVMKRLGSLLEAMTLQRLRAQPREDVAQIRDLLSGIDHRLGMLEERQDFAEAIITSGDSKLLGMRGAAFPQERN